ncbi:MAG: carboxypeptidase-like regulatory domain-containing protein, partial [Cyclobacteriaceae bacterium]
MCSILRHFIRSGILAFALLIGNLATAQTVALSTPLLATNNVPKQEISSLKTVLNHLETKHDVRFNYASQLVEGKRVDSNSSNRSKTLDEALELLLPPLGLRHEKISDQIYGIYPVAPKVKSKKEESGVTEQQSFYDAHVNAVNRMKNLPLRAPIVVEKNISGTVLDEEQSPLPGVNVLVKATTIGTVTDIDGNYRLTVPDDAQTLVFSSVGYETQEVNINGRSVVDLTMSPDIKALSEVVV